MKSFALFLHDTEYGVTLQAQLIDELQFNDQRCTIIVLPHDSKPALVHHEHVEHTRVGVIRPISLMHEQKSWVTRPKVGTMGR